ncbi:MAG: aldolase catalytic domain-containing protein [Planctomycetaceae bacterium]|nr:aldolase catalytic domain-containing protein [Planctomycetaceae bacterium]
MFRPEIKVVDCTIRDGGLINDSHFTFETVREVYKAICASGVDYVELGYRNSKEMFDPKQFGPWRFCDEDQLRRVTDGIDTGTTKLAVMQDAHKADPNDVAPADQSVVKMIRVATYVKDIDKAIMLANNATDKGYESAINIMSISKEGGPFLDEALQQIEEETKVKAVYIVDSYGALYSEEIQFFVEKFKMFIKTKEVGIHCHNNQQLAFANTIEGIIHHANFVDGTLYGLGRAAGNCPLELLIGFLKNPKFSIVPIIDVIGKTILPLKKEIDWGYCIPYMLAGTFNQHPRVSMEWVEGNNPNRDDFVRFYNMILEDPEQ